jgi:tRNA dimethylallyltransferase
LPPVENAVHAVKRVAIIGPTASGKSALAMSVCRARGDAEIVSIDAMQVYRGMNIGTASPSDEERAAVVHHLIDIVEPDEEFTVAQFQSAYASVMVDLEARSRRAVLVGGTGLYLRAVTDGLTLPGQWPEIRERLEREAEIHGPESLHERLRELDPLAASRMESSNARRVVRALEVIEGCGRPFSSFGPGFDSYPQTDVAQVGLRWPRDVLARRIESRVRSMIAAGWVEEVRSLLDGPRSVSLSRTAAQALGYKEIIDHLHGHLSLEATIEEIVLRTRQFAVRQERWFRRDPRIRWFDIDHDPAAELTPVVLELLA